VQTRKSSIKSKPVNATLSSRSAIFKAHPAVGGEHYLAVEFNRQHIEVLPYLA